MPQMRQFSRCSRARVGPACDSPQRFAARGRRSHIIPCQTVGWPLSGRLSGRREGGKSGLHGGTVPGNARRGRPQGKCHRNTPPSPVVHGTALRGRTHGTAWAARVKWCGKSAPRRRQRRRQGKPHREQDQVGAAGGACPTRAGAAGRACRAAARVGRARRSATNVPDEWPSSPRTRGGTEPGLQTVWQPSLL